MDQIIDDESGELLSEYFYRFHVPFSDESVSYTEPDRDETWVVARRTPTDDELRERRPGDQTWIWVRTVDIWDEQLQDFRDVEVKRFDCPVSRDHVTHSTYSEYQLDVMGGLSVGDIVPEFSGRVILSALFAEKLRKSGLKAFDLMRPTAFASQGERSIPELFVLRFLGRGGRRPRKVVGAPNACPFCGAGPLICAACGHEVIRCSKCENMTRILSSVHKGTADKRLRMAPEPKAGEILDGSRWDGSDFFNCAGSPYVTRRAVGWLLSVHAAPFYARPVRVWVDRMSDEQRERLERAKRPVGT